MHFTKMHGAGNDYVYVDLFHERVPDPVSAAIAVSDRHFGIGSDGLILIGPSAARMSRLRDVYRYVLYIKSPEYDKLIDCRNRIEALQLPWRDVGIQYDHDPVHGF
jgi:diaminopimelate epimerase